jgi:PAS domain S-box-containing protein
MGTELTNIAFRTTFLYILLGGLWILFSDRAVMSFTSDPGLYTQLSTYKGWAFVLVTGIMLYLTLRTQLRRWNAEFETRRKVEAELRQSEERFQLAMEGTNDGVWDWKLDTDAMYFSPRWKGMLGYRDEELPDRYSSWKNLVHPDDVDAVEAHIRDYFEDRIDAYETEYRMRHKSGRFLNILSRGKLVRNEQGLPVRFVSTHYDMTERKQAELAVRQSEARFRSFIEQAPVGVCEMDGRGKYTDANPEVLAMLGYGLSELLGKRIEDLTAEGDKILALSSFAELLAKGRAETEYRVLRKDGSALWISVVAVSLEEDRYLAYIRNVTTRRDAEEKLKTSLHEKEVLLKEIHHRVKNNLQVISSLISLQAEELKDPEARAAFRESRQRVRSMALIHENLYQSENLASIRIKDYLETVTKEFRRSHKNGNVTMTTDVEAVNIGIDTAVPCGLIINELLTNAFKHAFPGDRGGSIGLRLSRVSPAALRLVIEDDGIGFPEGVDFRSLTSMGMTLVLSLTQQIDGKISLERAGGTRFTVDFPA